MKNVLAAIDFSPVSDNVVAFAAKLAKVSNTKLFILHIASPEPDFVGYDVGPETERDAVAERFRREHRELQAIAERVREHGVEVTALLVQGPTIEKLLEESRRLESEHIVVGTHGRGAVGRMLLGSVSEGIVREAGMPVTVIPSIEEGTE